MLRHPYLAGKRGPGGSDAACPNGGSGGHGPGPGPATRRHQAPASSGPSVGPARRRSRSRGPRGQVLRRRDGAQPAGVDLRAEPAQGGVRPVSRNQAARSSVPASPSDPRAQKGMASAPGISSLMSRYRSMPEPAGISLPMMMFSFEPEQLVGLALDARLGQHPGGLLERGRRQPALGGQRGPGDARRSGRPSAGRLGVCDQLAVDLGVGSLSTRSPGGRGVVAARPPAPAAASGARSARCACRGSHTLVPVDLWTSSTRYCSVSRMPLDLQELLGVASGLRPRHRRPTSSPSPTSRWAPEPPARCAPRRRRPPL